MEEMVYMALGTLILIIMIVGTVKAPKLTTPLSFFCLASASGRVGEIAWTEWIIATIITMYLITRKNKEIVQKNKKNFWTDFFVLIKSQFK